MGLRSWFVHRGQVVATERAVPEIVRMRHDEKVARISRQLRERDPTRPVSLRKKAVSHQVPKRNDLRRSDQKIDISDLNEILEIDVVERTCIAEPGVTFVDLVAATMRYGLVPIVVPELKTITIGGAVAGCSIESTSFVHGGFHDTCLDYEIVTGTGEVLRCTPENEHQLVFQMLHGTFGTLGILTKLELKLMPAKPYVEMEYEKYRTIEEYQRAIHGHFVARDCDFMDGIIHSPNEWVLSIGRFVDSAPYTNAYDWTKVYYQSTRKRTEDFLRTSDYFFRYDRGVTNVHPKSFVGRLLLGKLMGSSEVLQLAEKLHWLLDDESPTITLDVFLPFSKLAPFLEWHERTLGYYPLWCVPYRRVRDYEWLSPRIFDGLEDELFVDIAIYGMKQRRGTNLHKLIEEKLYELGGLKTLISHNYYSEEEFWRTWNRPNYVQAKQVTDPHNVFRDLYTKTCRAAQGLE